MLEIRKSKVVENVKDCTYSFLAYLQSNDARHTWESRLPVILSILDLLLPEGGEGVGSEIAVGKMYASILIQDCFRR
jgi:hypothetical protein